MILFCSDVHSVDGGDGKGGRIWETDEESCLRDVAHLALVDGDGSACNSTIDSTSVKTVDSCEIGDLILGFLLSEVVVSSLCVI